MHNWERSIRLNKVGVVDLGKEVEEEIFVKVSIVEVKEATKNR